MTHVPGICCTLIEGCVYMPGLQVPLSMSHFGCTLQVQLLHPEYPAQMVPMDSLLQMPDAHHPSAQLQSSAAPASSRSMAHSYVSAALPDSKHHSVSIGQVRAAVRSLLCTHAHTFGRTTHAIAVEMQLVCPQMLL